ncbi:MAG TPA: ABC transporter transmembrane domain-containing protein, partial [Thermomicrobiales bacterium]|nr:ABC transporter transmembrane domain-containing protein [Thermomicrobiales bacterium]
MKAHASRSPFANLPASARRTLPLLALLSAGKAIALVCLAGALASGIVSAIDGTDRWKVDLLWGIGAGVTRAIIAWATPVVANRAALGAKEELRAQLAERAAVRGGRDLPQGVGELTTLATRGLDDLDPWFTQYLPALMSATTIPLLVGVRILTADWISALIVALTIPLIPVFMILIGWQTQERMANAADALARLSDHLVELARGLPVLVGLGRADAQTRTLRDVSGRYREKTMATLRIAFLSSLALELIATISVALVAVVIGVRLVHGDLGLDVALLVLILAPECYLPFREVGAAHHASEDGIEALQRAKAVIATPVSQPLLREIRPVAFGLAVEDLTVQYADRSRPAVERLNFRANPGQIVALVGPSGAGKSTALAAIAGLIGDGGESGARVEGRIDGVDPAKLAWVPQHPVTYAESVREEIALACDIPRADIIDTVLRRVDAGNLADRHPGELSPGEL